MSRTLTTAPEAPSPRTIPSPVSGSATGAALTLCSVLKQDQLRGAGSKEQHYEGLLPYDLRRSAVRNLKRAGVDNDTIMKITGHLIENMIRCHNIADVNDVKMKQVERQNASLIQVAQKQGRKK